MNRLRRCTGRVSAMPVALAPQALLAQVRGAVVRLHEAARVPGGPPSLAAAFETGSSGFLSAAGVVADLGFLRDVARAIGEVTGTPVPPWLAAPAITRLHQRDLAAIEIRLRDSPRAGGTT